MKIHLDDRDGKFWVDEESFDKGPVGRNKFMSAVMRRVMLFGTAQDSLNDSRTDYHQDVLAGVAKPTNREEYFRGTTEQQDPRPELPYLRQVQAVDRAARFGPDGY